MSEPTALRPKPDESSRTLVRFRVEVRKVVHDHNGLHVTLMMPFPKFQEDFVLFFEHPGWAGKLRPGDGFWLDLTPWDRPNGER